MIHKIIVSLSIMIDSLFIYFCRKREKRGTEIYPVTGIEERRDWYQAVSETFINVSGCIDQAIDMNAGVLKHHPLAHNNVDY